MRLSFEGNIQSFQPGLEELSGAYGFSLSEDGIPVTIRQCNKPNIQVSLDNGRGTICVHDKIHFFRALSLFLEHAERGDSFQLDEKPQFNMNGIMLDCSRNAVMKPEKIGQLLRTMAMMGLNMLMLYVEDTYEIKEQPYFGYMRGRYSEKELKQIDEYAHQFGIEVIPSIQTLAHLSTFLRWDTAFELKDTSDILLAGSSQTYELIEQMIASITSPFRTNRIHIGMDEAHLLGKGQYLKKNGFKPSFEIMNDHLNEVLKITNKYHLTPMIWSDMYFRMASEQGHYYDTEADTPQRVIDEMPTDLQFVYWDYYHEDEAFYQNFLNKHKAFGSTPLFAGGLWTWNGNVINYKKAFNTVKAALSACKKEGVNEVFATLWGDDGQETNPLTGLLGMQMIAEFGYADELDIEKLNRRFKYCTGAETDAFMLLGELDQPPGSAEEVQLEPDNPAKFLLWQDPLLGLFDAHVEGLMLDSYYEKLEVQLQKGKEKTGEWSFLFDVPIQISSVLSLKGELGVRLKQSYDSGDKESLEYFSRDVLPELKQRVKKLRSLHYQEWMAINKPFGWEVLDIRYGGLLARIDTTHQRLLEYLEGQLVTLPELEEERLAYTAHNERRGYVRCNTYKRIVTPNVF